jgi:formiminotetrahydrofolate cyclodeaminase
MALVDASVGEFLARVASTEHAVPAGGSVAALTGASSAALLALVAGVMQRKSGESLLLDLFDRAEALRARLLGLVDEDAAAYEALLERRRAKADVSDVALRTARMPLEIAHACRAIVVLSHQVEQHTAGPMEGDVRAARHLAQAASLAALDLVEQNLGLLSLERRQEIRAELAHLRAEVT